MTAEHHSGAVMPAETPGESDAGIRRRKKGGAGCHRQRGQAVSEKARRHGAERGDTACQTGTG